jgi:RimJ/RimL family protein N-acetyltransferase
VSDSRSEEQSGSSPSVDEPTIRAASVADRELLWRWANDPDARAASFDTERIPWETHVAWLDAKLADPASRIYVVGEGNMPKAVVRFEGNDEGVAVVSIVVDPGERGRGLGTRALRLSCRSAARELSLHRVDAYIRHANGASITAFERAGFLHVAESGRLDATKMVWHPETR